MWKYLLFVMFLKPTESWRPSLKEQFAKHGILALNLISSPGAGKTSLLERTLTDLASEFRMAVIEGDLQTDNDARRVAATGAKAVQINTDGGCHLDSNIVMEALGAFDLNEIDILFIRKRREPRLPRRIRLRRRRQDRPAQRDRRRRQA